MQSSRALGRNVAAVGFAIVSLASACLDAVAPTPVSASVTITPVNKSIRGKESADASGFDMELRVRNTGSQTIFLDRIYARTEKLIDQDWEVAIETTGAPFTSVRALVPNQITTFTYHVLYLRASSPPMVHLDHIRGLYRARLRLSFTSNGSSPLPPEESYSQPFAVQ